MRHQLKTSSNTRFAPRRNVVFASECVAIALLALGAWLGAHEFVGEFGRTGQPKECGSVWGLPTSGDLNAATCKGDLHDRVTLVAVVIGTAGVIRFVTPVLAYRQSTRRWLLVVAVTVPLVVSTVLIVLGRHFISRVSGA